MAQPKLTAAQARRLLAAEDAVVKAEAAAEDATRKRNELRDRYRSRVPLSEDKEERARQIRVAIVGGIRVRVAPTVSPERLSLKRYREAGHEITPEMREAISPGSPYDRWTVKKRG